MRDLTGDLRRRLRRRRYLRSLALHRLLAAFARAYPRAVFAEVGANDGAKHDHLRTYILSHEWTGVMVEPVPHIFARLRANYAGIDRVSFENAAVADHDGTLPFYGVRDASAAELQALPDWYDGVGSFHREAILSHAPQVPDIAERIVTREVASVRFDTLCRRHRIERLDLLLVDTEGHDWEVLRGVDLAALRPRLIVYEHFHLARADRAACRAHLESAGYELKEEGLDTMALRPDPDGLTRRFRRLRPAAAGIAKADEPAV